MSRGPEGEARYFIRWLGERGVGIPRVKNNNLDRCQPCVSGIEVGLSAKNCKYFSSSQGVKQGSIGFVQKNVPGIEE